MNIFILAYVIAIPVFVGIDMAWLLGPGRPIYVREIGSLMRTSPNLAAAGAFYLIYCLGLVYFAVSGAVANGQASQALWAGALFGLVAYATYDLTNLAVMNGFTLRIALIDMVWGAVLSGVVAWIVATACLKLT